MYGFMTILLSLLLSSVPLVLGAFDVRTKFQWLDSSCDGKDDVLNTAGQNMVDMASAAEDALVPEAGDVVKRTLKAFFNQEPQYGAVLKNKYSKISAFKTTNTPYSLYCDSSAFTFVTTYQEDEEGGKKKGDTIAASEAYDGGLWYVKRRKPGDPPLYIKGQKRDDYCTHPTLNKEAAGVSTKGGKHVVLCPPAFENTIDFATAQGTTYPNNKPLKDFEGLSITLFHEVTHCAFSTNDDAYGPFQCIALAVKKPNGGYKAQNNADSFSYFALAVYLNKNTWYKTFSGPLPAEGSSGQTKKRRTIGGRLAELAKVAIAPSTLVKRQIPPVSSEDTPKTSSGGAQEAIVAATISGEAITETFVPTTYSNFRSVTAPVTVSTQDAAGNDLSIIIAPSGLGWRPLNLSSGEPVLPRPTSLPLGGHLPSSAIASLGSSGILTGVTASKSQRTAITTTPLISTPGAVVSSNTDLLAPSNHPDTFDSTVGKPLPTDITTAKGITPSLGVVPSSGARLSSGILPPSGSALLSGASPPSGTGPLSGAVSSSSGSSAIVTSPSSPLAPFPSSTVQSSSTLLPGSISNSKSSGGALLPNGPANTDGVPSTSNTDNAPKTTSQIPGTDSAPLPTITNTNKVSTQSYSTLPPGVTGNSIYHHKDDNGHDDPMPFLWHCFFCGGGGLALPGFGTVPGVYPPPVPPPVPNFPTITIGKDNIPTPGSEPDGDDDNHSKTEDNDNSKTTAAQSTKPGSTSDFQTSSMAITSSFASSSAPSSSSSGTAESYVIEDADYFTLETVDAAESSSVEAYILSLAGASIPTGSVTTSGLTAPSNLSTGGQTTSVVQTSKATSDNAQSTTTDAATSSSPAVESSSSIAPPSSSTAPPPTPTVSPVDPPSAPSCYPIPTGHLQDSHDYNVDTSAKNFCKKYASDTVTDSTVNIDHTFSTDSEVQYAEGNDAKDDTYDFTILSVDGCDPGDGGYNLKQPVNDNSCKDILKNAWKNCNNKGRGGVITAGCLKYGIRTVY